jgi:hypothetical protein
MSDESGHSDCGEIERAERAFIKRLFNEAPLENEIRNTCLMLADFLVEKNRAYGNSAADPVGIFARRADPLLQIDVRIDDKINRLKKGSEYPGDDTVKDLAGYLILRMIVAEQQKKEGEK